jgi:hypothetical protein
MATLETIASVAAVGSALLEVYKFGNEPFTTVLSRSRASITPETVDAVSVATFGSYTDEEVRSIEKRLLQCRKRFIIDGDGAQRRRCMCGVLKDVAQGNGGLPGGIWSELSQQLNCKVG